MSHLMKIHPVEAEKFRVNRRNDSRTDGRRDM